MLKKAVRRDDPEGSLRYELQAAKSAGRLLSAGNCREGMRTLKDGRYVDHALLGIHMPMRTGLEVLKQRTGPGKSGNRAPVLSSEGKK